jgi:hypothetical protein
MLISPQFSHHSCDRCITDKQPPSESSESAVIGPSQVINIITDNRWPETVHCAHLLKIYLPSIQET